MKIYTQLCRSIRNSREEQRSERLRREQKIILQSLTLIQQNYIAAKMDENGKELRKTSFSLTTGADLTGRAMDELRKITCEVDNYCR